MSAASSFETGSDWCIIAYDACCQIAEPLVSTPLPTPGFSLPEFSMPGFSMPTASPSETPTFDVSNNVDPSYCFICREGSDYGGDDYCSRQALSFVLQCTS